MKRAEKIQSVEDARDLAERRLPRALYQLFEGGSGSNVTQRRNVEAFEQLMFRPRGGICAAKRELSTTVLGHRISMPVLTSSIGLLGLAHPDGEPGVARATGAAGTIQFVSGATTTAIEEVMAAASGPVYYQLYYFGGREASAAIIERVRRAGCAGLVLNFDAAAPPPPRQRLYRQRADVPAGSWKDLLAFSPQLLAKPAWTMQFFRNRTKLQMAMALGPDGRPMHPMQAFGSIFQETPAWEDLPWIRKQWDGPLIIKGILTVEDARRAVAAGATAIVVSNHGGNSLDGSVPTLSALPAIAAAVGDQIEVLMDGGVRRGVDVVKALALGARAVLLGRAYLYPFLAAGEQGVARILEIFRQEIDSTLAFLGCRSVHELSRDHLASRDEWQVMVEASQRSTRSGQRAGGII